MAATAPPAETAEAPASEARSSTAAQRFWLILGLIVAAGLGLRIWAVFTYDAPQGITDAQFYRLQALLIAHGHGFAQPFLTLKGEMTATALHPPLFSLLLAGAAKLGIDTETGVRLVSITLGAGTVFLSGVLGRRLGGARVGLLAAGLVALSPDLWTTEHQGLSESLVALLAVATILLAYRFLERPSLASAAWVGGVLGLLTLTRAEQVLLYVVLIPVVAVQARWPEREAGPEADRSSRWSRWRRPLAATAVACLVGAAVMAPWVVRNLTTFDEPTLLTTNGGVTLAAAWCDPALRGDIAGLWYHPCLDQAHEKAPEDYDESEVDLWFRAAAKSYAMDHVDQWPWIASIRVGRVWGVYRPSSGAFYDGFEGRGETLANLVMRSWLVTLPFIVAGGVVAHRRGVALWPILSFALTVVVTAMVFYGGIRFRISAVPGLLVLAAFALDALWGLAARRLGRST